MADVQFERQEYLNAKPDWALVGDVCRGDRAVKKRGEEYLPNPSAVEDNPNEKKAVYDRYKQRASFYNATGYTREGLIGAVFRKVPTFTAPDALNYLESDADGAGVSIYQQSQEVLGQVLGKGRAGLLVDYPTTDAPASRAQQAAGLIRATINSYDAEQIINWRTTKIGGAHLLSLVVIHEHAEEPTADGFGLEAIEQFRHLSLEEGVYIVRIWRKPESGGAFVIHEESIPKRGNGQPWDRIPFTFVGARNNDSDVDKAPLLDLATLNIKHYQVGADWYNALFYAGQPQPWMSGLTEQWVAMLEEKGVVMGSRSPMMLPEGGQFGIETVTADTALQKELEAIEQRMVALGARLVQPGQAVKTATQAQDESETQHSILSLAASNVSEAYGQCLAWVGEFMAAAGEALYQLNQDLTEHSLDAQMLKELVAAWMSGAIPEGDLWAYLRKVGLIDPEKTDEEIREETQNDAGLNLDDMTDGGTGTTP
jgi:hypothetical protein